MNDKWYNSSFASDLGAGLFWFLIATGIGGCTLLSNFGMIKEPEKSFEKTEQIINNNPVTK